MSVLRKFEEVPYSEFVYDVVEVTNTATALRVGVSNMTGRRKIVIQPKSGTIYVGFDNTVTAGNNGTGRKITSGSVYTEFVDEGATIWAIKSGSGNVKTSVQEAK